MLENTYSLSITKLLNFQENCIVKNKKKLIYKTKFDYFIPFQPSNILSMTGNILEILS